MLLRSRTYPAHHPRQQSGDGEEYRDSTRELRPRQHLRPGAIDEGHQRGEPLLALVPVLIIAALMANTPVRPDIILVVGLAVFGAAFAINSSVHSYLILAYAGSEKAAEDVGFYYAANAAGRFTGTLLSGLLYQWGGLTACLAGSAIMLALCFVTTMILPLSRKA